MENVPRYQDAANDSNIDPTANALSVLLSSVEKGGNALENGKYNTLLQKFDNTFPGFKLTFDRDGTPLVKVPDIQKYASESNGMVTPRDVWLSIKGLIDSYPAHIPTPTANRRATTTV